MLAIDSNGNIQVTRGDTFEIPLFIDVNTNMFKSIRFPLHKGDIIYFHILEGNKPFECPLLSKKFTYEDTNENNDIIVRFNHTDTFKLFPGIYFYQVLLQRPSGKDNDPSDDFYITLVPRRKFVVQ